MTRGASFITPEGQFVHLPAGVDHPDAIRRAGVPPANGEVGDNRVDFLSDAGVIRTRFSRDRAGDTLHVSVPAQGVTADQIPALRQAVGKLGRYGNLVLELADIYPDSRD